MTAAAEGRRIRIRGTVQGVGFRPWVFRTAVESGVSGRVRNDSTGVTIDAFGDEGALRTFEAALHADPPPAARIVEYDSVAIASEPLGGFVIEHSEPTADRRVSIPPDLATCGDCVADILDPSNRRFRYAFTNCTNCGPRFTIATDVPYDRAATTMAPFEMCDPCRREYEDVGDRRFHAQPTACPTCGPRLELVALDDEVRLKPDTTHGTPPPVVSGFSRTGTHGDVVSGFSRTSTPADGVSGFSRTPEDPIARAARAIRDGLIVAVKGIGGFHLACDATSDLAVQRLRARKHRDEKPLAVMVSGIEAAAEAGVLGPVHRTLLQSPERPIVLVEKRPDSPLAPSIAPRNRQVGLMLPYTPLHHLLLADVGRPLVMTSGNLSDEPIAFTNDDARRRLAGIADYALLHDRDVHTRCDDSVAMVVGGAPMVIRRSRGYVPRAFRLARPMDAPVLATGALLKNTFCLAAGQQAFLGPHIGDLENLETYDSFTTAVERLSGFLDIRPAVAACDLHPDYLSTQYAEQQGLPVVHVQHHHAHIVSAMAEHAIDGPVIGIAYDGTGFGTDGTSWGGEVMLATPARFERLATFRPLALSGGDHAVREPWRTALALLLSAYDGSLPDDVAQLMPSVTDQERDAVATLIRRGVHVAAARGVGRYFDAFGALFLGRRRAAFEGQVALEWNQVAEPLEAGAYAFDLDTRRHPIEIDLRPTVRAALADARSGIAVGVIAARFHNTLARATTAAVNRAARLVGRLPVVASGGCFQNARLAEAVVAGLSAFDVRLHREVPPGDGGIALGQAVIANAIAAAA
jgi:hydrogenase maturation protein HypF